MRFLLDAHLPQRPAGALQAAGHDALHTSELLHGNRSTDDEVSEAADAQDRVVITKDRDFRDSHLLRGSPRRLLVLRTGNTSNAELVGLFETHLPTVVAAFEVAAFVEMTPAVVITHRYR